jgi:hypothetical protein
VCSGGRLLADFVAGTQIRPEVPELADSLTRTVDGDWVVWAYKLARVSGDQFLPLTGRGSYTADATASCLADNRRRHTAPDLLCSCGFHALSLLDMPGFSTQDCALLTVALSGRVLAFEWAPGGVLLRAARQSVLRVDVHPLSFEKVLLQIEKALRRPDDPDTRPARTRARPPSGAGPVRLNLPGRSVLAAVADDPGWCRVEHPVPAMAASEPLPV